MNNYDEDVFRNSRSYLPLVVFVMLMALGMTGAIAWFVCGIAP